VLVVDTHATFLFKSQVEAVHEVRRQEGVDLILELVLLEFLDKRIIRIVLAFLDQLLRDFVGSSLHVGTEQHHKVVHLFLDILYLPIFLDFLLLFVYLVQKSVNLVEVMIILSLGSTHLLGCVVQGLLAEVIQVNEVVEHRDGGLLRPHEGVVLQLDVLHRLAVGVGEDDALCIRAPLLAD
jgi:hypothetical protein